MKSVDFREFHKNLAGYLRRARLGEEISVTSHGKEIARLVPPVAVQPKPRQMGGLAGRIWIADDFDETPPDIIAAMEGDIE